MTAYFNTPSYLFGKLRWFEGLFIPLEERNVNKSQQENKTWEKVYFRGLCTELVENESKDGGENSRRFIFLWKLKWLEFWTQTEFDQLKQRSQEKKTCGCPHNGIPTLQWQCAGTRKTPYVPINSNRVWITRSVSSALEEGLGRSLWHRQRRGSWGKDFEQCTKELKGVWGLLPVLLLLADLPLTCADEKPRGCNWTPPIIQQ